MSPKERQEEICEYLRLYDNWITVKKMAQNFNVSTRTIYNDLDKINYELKDTRWQIEKKRGIGVRLKVIFNKNNNLIRAKDFSDRKLKILMFLLNQTEAVSYEYLSKVEFVSVTSIKKDIDEIKRILMKHTNLSVISDRNGTQIEGSEESIRDALIWCNQYILDSQPFINQENLTRVNDVFKCFYDERSIDFAYETLFEFIKKRNRIVSDYYFLYLLNVYIVQIHRLRFNNLISENTSFVKDNGIKEEMKLNSKFITGAEYLLNNASNTFEFQYTKKEVEYLSAYLFLNRIEYIPLKVTNSKLVLEIIDQISSSLKVNFNKNMSLKSELEQHIISMLYRLKYGIKVENSLVNYIKNEYGDTFYIIKLTLDDFESRFGIDFNDEELALLTIYFQSAIEQQRQKKKVLVVCQYGLAMSNLLITRLENILNSKYNIESSSLVDLKLEEISKYDLVISTIESLHGDNVLRISSFPTEGDIFKIQKKLTDSVNLINKNCLTQNFLNSKYIFLESKFKDKGSLLQYITEKLLKDNIIQEEYINSLYRREKVGNTDLPNGVAIPHGSSKYGNQTLIVIINNKNKIYWNKYFINNIFIPVISPKDTKFVKSIIKEIYNVINDEQSIYNFPEYLSSIKRRLKK